MLFNCLYCNIRVSTALQMELPCTIEMKCSINNGTSCLFHQFHELHTETVAIRLKTVKSVFCQKENKQNTVEHWGMVSFPYSICIHRFTWLAGFVVAWWSHMFSILVTTTIMIQYHLKGSEMLTFAKVQLDFRIIFLPDSYAELNNATTIWECNWKSSLNFV